MAIGFEPQACLGVAGGLNDIGRTLAHTAGIAALGEHWPFACASMPKLSTAEGRLSPWLRPGSAVCMQILDSAHAFVFVALVMCVHANERKARHKDKRKQVVTCCSARQRGGPAACAQQGKEGNRISTVK